jgi:hypothetical protein
MNCAQAGNRAGGVERTDDCGHMDRFAHDWMQVVDILVAFTILAAAWLEQLALLGLFKGPAVFDIGAIFD